MTGTVFFCSSLIICSHTLVARACTESSMFWAEKDASKTLATGDKSAPQHHQLPYIHTLTYALLYSSGASYTVVFMVNSILTTSPRDGSSISSVTPLGLPGWDVHWCCGAFTWAIVISRSASFSIYYLGCRMPTMSIPYISPLSHLLCAIIIKCYDPFNATHCQ